MDARRTGGRGTGESRRGAGARGWGRSFRRGALETLAVLVSFAAFGLAWAAVEARVAAAPPAYPPDAVERTDDTPSIWLVDGFNVLCRGVLRDRERAAWWTRERREDLLARARRFDDPDAEIWVVFDGSRPREDANSSGPHRVQEVFAPSADDWLVARVRQSADPSRLAVVTADRKVAGRARHRGAQVVAPRVFLERCEGVRG